MKEQDYQPYYLEAVTQPKHGVAILSVRPQDYRDTDYYHEIHIEANNEYLQSFDHTIGQYIYIHLLSPTQLEVYEGEFYEESSSNGPWEYQSFSYKKIEKPFRNEWKPKYNELLVNFRKLFNQKVNLYETTREKVVAAYQRIYTLAIQDTGNCGLSIAEIEKTSLFGHLYRLFYDNPAWDGLATLVDPGYLHPKTPKDWKQAYVELAIVMGNLTTVDLNDYATIRDHMMLLYRRSFNYQLPNLQYNHKEADEEKYNCFFEHLMEQLKQTEAN